MQGVSIVGSAQIKIERKSTLSLREMGAKVVRLAMEDAGVEKVDALFAGNMLADELQGQKHVATMIASAANLPGIEALQVRAATATGAAALRMAYFAVASGEADLAVAVGVEKMSDGEATPALAKALDAERELPGGATLVSQNARLMQLYMDRYHVPYECFTNFPINSHHNALGNPYALFHKEITPQDVRESKLIVPPLRLYDCSPICDGAAAVILAPGQHARAYCAQPVHILSSAVATDWFAMADRPDPLQLLAVQRSVFKALKHANVNRQDVDFIEAHDAFSIMCCLLLESAGYAPMGEGWKLAENGDIFLGGKLPICTLGGLKARGHPIGATALYQACEIVAQLSGKAGANQLPNPHIGMLLSVGGAAATILTHILAND
jgi:acetyl-CoA C-acetyltransferase